jgi:predicted Rossmann fold flavoprotein
MKDSYDVIVIGGGASGMMAAGIAGRSGKRVLVLEKNKEMGAKLKITGGGRCNVTHAEFDVRKLLPFYKENEKFLYSAFSQFGVQDTFDFFENLGLPLVIQALNRAFPKTEKALDVFKVLEKFMKDNGVTVITKSPVTQIHRDGNHITSVTAGGKVYFANSFILATGGVSHPETGSTGDGFTWLKDLGHTIADPTPSIVPIAVSNPWIHALSGKSFDNVKITFFLTRNNVTTKSFFKVGRVLATHFGLSGPLILNSAQKIGDLLHEGEVTATINLFPGQDLGAVEKFILETFDAHKNKSFKNVFSELVPPGMASGILPLVEEFIPFLELDTKVHSVTKDSRKKLVKLLTELPVEVTGLMGLDRAVVADGGIPLDEIDTRTMQSKKINSLFITGDLLHVNRPTGGQSLQLCWTTGYVAGKHA